MDAALTQIAQHADDLDRAEAYYRLLLDAAPTARFDPPGLLFFTVGTTRLLLDRAAPSALHYFGVTSIGDTLARLGDLADLVTERHLIFEHEDAALGPVGAREWQAFLRDSEGNTIGLVEFEVGPATG